MSLKNKREYGIAIGASVWTGINYTIQFKSHKIPRGNTWNLGKIDQAAQFIYRQTPKSVSDYTLLATAAFAGYAMLGKEKAQWFSRGVVMAQNIWLTANLAHSSKMLFRRNRPYTQAPGFVYSKRDDVYSFFSGHTALAATMVTTSILMYRNEPSLPGKKLALGASVLCAGTTMYLRIRSGKHYPSDIIAGILVGTGIAWLNYKIHEI